MPFPLIPVIGAGLSLGAQVYNTWTQNQANNKNVAAQEDINAQNIQATKENNALARQWAVEDFNKTNAYNAPTQQMQRLREAGLNPNLVYGSGAQTTAAMIRGTQPIAPHANPVVHQAVQVGDYGAPVNTFMALKTAQVDLQNKQAQTNLLSQEQTKNQLETAGMATKNAQTSLELAKARDLYDTSLENARLHNQTMMQGITSSKVGLSQNQQRIDLSQQELALKQAKNPVEIQSIHQDIVRKTIENSALSQTMKDKLNNEVKSGALDNSLKEWELKLRSAGLTSHDPAWARLIALFAEKHMNDKGVKFGTSINQDSTLSPPKNY